MVKRVNNKSVSHLQINALGKYGEITARLNEKVERRLFIFFFMELVQGLSKFVVFVFALLK